MRAAGIFRKWLIWYIIVLLALPYGISAQDSGQVEQADDFSKEELAQMLAPIALYPDSLITDILMASTYPLEVVEAERWLRNNKDLKNDALNTALQEKTWDASIKVLCHFPDVLFVMSEKLDQTRKLGDAFLSQQEEVMGMVQELRSKALEQGNLKTTGEQTVTLDGEIVKIEPVDPQVIYVPVYDPLYVYGPWWYPAYPPYYWYYPGGVVIVGGYVSFGTRFFIGIDLFPWFRLDWRRHIIHIDHDRKRHFDRFDKRREFERPFWRHDPSHRRGVAYRDITVGERFGERKFRKPQPTMEIRGFPSTKSGSITVTPSRKPDKSGLSRRRFEAPAVAPRTIIRDTPFSGIGDGRFEQKARERGEKSRRIEKQDLLKKDPDKKGTSPGGGGRFRNFQKK